MRRRLLLIAAIACAVAAVIAWRLVRRGDSSTTIDPERAAEVLALVDKARAAEPVAKTPGYVVIRGVVRDAAGGTPVAGMTVRLDAPGVNPTTSGPDGAFAFEAPPGWYRIYALGEEYASVARISRERLPTRPHPTPRDVTSDRLPLVDMRDHIVGLELQVARMYQVNVRVTDPDGRPVAAATVRARGAVLPVDHSEVGTTDREGKTWLRLASGQYRLEAAHDDFAGPRDTQVIEVAPTGMTLFDVVLARGCIVEGRVVDTHGKPAGDGAIERRSGFTDRDFGPAGSIDSGRFTWATLDTGEVILRAWPWGSPPSAERSFICTDGGRFRDVELRLGNAPPDLHGTLVDADGAPVPFGYLDVIALDDTGGNQQERTDASGRWGVFNLAPGRYIVSAQTARGLVTEILVAPSPELVLKLDPPGKLAGATRGMTDGSFELVGASCRQSNVGNIALQDVTRIVPVRGGRFEVDELPACTLDAHALYRAHHAPFRIDIPAGGVTAVELDLGPLPDKTIAGTVRDDAGKIVADAVVTATLPKGGSGLARSDERGRFTLTAPAGTSLMATGTGGVGYATVGGANVDIELVDIVLGQGRPPLIE